MEPGPIPFYHSHYLNPEHGHIHLFTLLLIDVHHHANLGPKLYYIDRNTHE